MFITYLNYLVLSEVFIQQKLKLIERNNSLYKMPYEKEITWRLQFQTPSNGLETANIVA